MPQATANRHTYMQFTKILCELISIASVNPMGRPVQGTEYFEARLSEHLEDFFHSLQLPTLRQPVAPHRDNILVRLDGVGSSPQRGPLLLWDVHQDTVPADHMTIDPFRPRVDGQRVYGRGACDVKGGMAAMLGALSHLVQTHPLSMPTIVMACTVNEEYGFSGAAELTRLWSGQQISDFLGRRPDACIVAEPTGLQTVVSHKGSVRWKCHTSGKAAHSSQPELGNNAIYQMSRVIECLEAYARDIVPQLAEHPLCGSPTLSIGTIAGGTSVNTVPERCTIEIDRRLVPGESPQEAYQHAIRHLSSLEDVPLSHESPMLESAGLADSENAGLATALSGAAKQRGIESRAVGVAYGTNAAIIAESGVPTVVFGPGSINQAHTADEWIDIGEVEAASGILFDLATSGPW